jgi:hypothetical protein
VLFGNMAYDWANTVYQERLKTWGEHEELSRAADG